MVAGRSPQSAEVGQVQRLVVLAAQVVHGHCPSHSGAIRLCPRDPAPSRDGECARACWEARGLECNCSRMGEHHGEDCPDGRWSEISDTCAVRWRDAELHGCCSCRRPATDVLERASTLWFEDEKQSQSQSFINDSGILRRSQPSRRPVLFRSMLRACLLGAWSPACANTYCSLSGSNVAREQHPIGPATFLLEREAGATDGEP